MKKTMLLVAILIMMACVLYGNNLAVSFKWKDIPVQEGTTLIHNNYIIEKNSEYLVIGQYEKEASVLVFTKSQEKWKIASSFLPLGEGPGEIKQVLEIRFLDKNRLFIRDHDKIFILNLKNKKIEKESRMPRSIPGIWNTIPGAGLKNFWLQKRTEDNQNMMLIQYSGDLIKFLLSKTDQESGVTEKKKLITKGYIFENKQGQISCKITFGISDDGGSIAYVPEFKSSTIIFSSAGKNLSFSVEGNRITQIQPLSKRFIAAVPTEKFIQKLRENEDSDENMQTLIFGKDGKNVVIYLPIKMNRKIYNNKVGISMLDFTTENNTIYQLIPTPSENSEYEWSVREIQLTIRE